MTKKRGTGIYQNVILLFFHGDACIKQESSRREFIHKELSGVATASENQNSRRYIYRERLDKLQKSSLDSSFCNVYRIIADIIMNNSLQIHNKDKSIL